MNHFFPRTLLTTILLVSTLLPATTSLVAAQDDATVTGTIETPSSADMLSAGQPFTVKGWLVDRSVSDSVGVDTVAISAQTAGRAPIDLGQARLAEARPDVAVALNNPKWTDAGYKLDAPGLPAGTYTLSVNAHTTSGWTSSSTNLTVGELDATRWSGAGFTIQAPSSVWPMLDLLHRMGFDWALASASQHRTPIVWADLPQGTYGQYSPSNNVIRLSNVLQSSGIEARTAFLAHELTHLNDDVNGRLGDGSGSPCYETEKRAFSTEANFWYMVFGKDGKLNSDSIEGQENTKMWAFVGNSRYADLVVRTTPSYVKQCGH